MPKKAAPLQHPTFHRIVEGCEQGERAAWQAFLTGYTPIFARMLATHFAPWPDSHRRDLWRDALSVLTANGFERLRSLGHQAEREFLIDLRAITFQVGAARLDRASDQAFGRELTPEWFTTSLKGRPIAQQEVAFLKLSGCSDSTLERMLLIPASAIQKAVSEFPSLSCISTNALDGCLWPAAWQAILAQARAARQTDCPDRRIFVRILEGQTTWYEKTPAEQHMVQCLHCLEYWVALREVNFLRRDSQPAPPADVQDLLDRLCPEAASPKPSSLFQRILRR